MRIPSNTNVNNSAYRISNNTKSVGVNVSKSTNVRLREIIVYSLKDDMIYSGGNASGLSFYLKYAPDSTEEDPVVIAKGVDENHKEFEKTIRINDINPNNATYVEMRALAAHLKLPPDTNYGQMNSKTGGRTLPEGLNDRNNYIEVMGNYMSDMRTIGRSDIEFRMTRLMNIFIDFWKSREPNNLGLR